MSAVKVRFAPSPTGYLHVGNCRTALMNWLFAKKMGGTFLLRFDDTDQERSHHVYETAILKDMAWLGLTHDEMARQSERLEAYAKAAQKLKDIGRLYPCYETAEELSLKRKRQLGQGLPPIYDRKAMTLTDAEKSALEARGLKPHWRFQLRSAPIVWEDMVRGPVRFEGANLSDPILIREDGCPVYTLASVVDDIDFHITHILRAEDHVANTAIQIQLFEALGKDCSTLHFAHPPLITNQEGGGLSKRLGSLSIGDLRESHILPQAINDLLGRLGTSLPIQPFFDIEPLIADFSFEAFSRSTPKFSITELETLNKKLLHTLPWEKIQPHLGSWPFMTDVLWEGIKTDLTSLKDLNHWQEILMGETKPVVDDEDRDFIEVALQTFPQNGWDQDPWALWMEALKPKTDRKGKTFFMPLRLALTGESHGPELATLLKIMGAAKAKERLSQALQKSVA